MAMDDSDINLLIPVKSVSEEFICPICYEVISECTMTHCSHNFCKSCIMECLNRKKTCPCCNAPTTVQQLSANKQFERVISIIVEEKEKASKEYFDALISGTSNGKSSSNGGNQIASKELSPIELVFHTHLKRSLLSYEEYYQKLKSKTEIREEKLKEHYKQLMIDHQKKVGTGRKALTVSQDPQISQWKAECEGKVAEIREILDKSAEFLQKSYEDYLKKCIPPPEFLPVLVNISVPSKNELIRNVHISPTDTGMEIKHMIAQRMEKKVIR